MMYFLYGTDAYRLRNGISDTRQTYLQTHPNASVVILDCATNEGTESLKQNIQYRSLFGEDRIIVALHALETDALVPIVEQEKINDRDDVLLLLAQEMPQKILVEQKKRCAAIVARAQKFFSYDALSESQRPAWVREFCAQRGCTIANDAYRELISRVGNESWALANELEKLCSYAGKGSITRDSVCLLVATAAEYDEWELSNAIAQHNKRSAITALFKHLAMGTPAQTLLASAASAVRNLLMIRDCADTHKPPAAIAATTGLHPYVVTKCLSGARNADPAHLQRTLDALAMLDRQSKDGIADGHDSLFLALLSL